MSVSGVGSGVVSTASSEVSSSTSSGSSGDSTKKVSPEGEIESILAKSFFDNQKLMQQIFDPVKDATDEGKE